MLLFRRDKKKTHAADSEEDGENETKSKSKKVKTGTEQDGGDDINEEDELLYLQAMDMEDNNCGGNDDGGVSQDEGQSASADVKLKVAPTVLAAGGTKRTVAATHHGSDSQPPKSKIQKTSQPAALKSSPNKKGSSQKIVPMTTSAPAPPKAAAAAAPVPSAPVPSAGASSAPAKGRAMPPLSPPPASMDATSGIELVSRTHWSRCKPFKADDFASTAAGSPLALPTKYSKDTQKAKWTAEVTKLKPYICTLERMMSSDGGKVKDTEFKNAIKAFQKINARVDKKLEYETSAASVAEPTFSARTLSFKEMFEAVKALKELAISSGKSGSIAEDVLKNAIERINTSVEKLIADRWIGYPLHWVQAQQWYGGIGSGLWTV